MRPEYQKILDAAVGIDRQQFEKLQQQIQIYDRNYRIHDEFHGRPDGQTIAEARQRLSQKYHTSESNIERIAYDL